MARPYWMPSPVQELLLAAALDPSDRATTAWQAWTGQIHLENDDLDSDSFKLLSLVYDNLHAALPDDPRMVKLKGITRYQWTKTQLALARGSRVLQLFQDQQIPTLLSKGGALISAGYVRAVARPMFDLDVLIPVSLRAAALDLLHEQGWTPAEVVPPSRFPLMNSLNYNWAADKTTVDIHWFSIMENGPGDDDLWRDSVPAVLQGKATRRLNDSDLCFHILAHGAHWPLPSRRWVSDIVLLLRGPAMIDWDRVCRNAWDRDLTLQTTAMLSYVRETFGAPIPVEATNRLRTSRVSRGERVLYWVRNRHQARWRGVLFHAHHYWWLTQGKNGLALTPARYMRDWWGVSRNRALPATLFRRAIRQLRKRHSKN